MLIENRKVLRITCTYRLSENEYYCYINEHLHKHPYYVVFDNKHITASIKC